MNRKLLAALLCTLIATPALAGLNCRDGHGTSIRWEIGDPKPDLSEFDVTSKNAVCYVNGALYAAYMPQYVTGLPYVKGLPQGSTGMIYRGTDAIWLLENLPAVVGLPSTGQDYRERDPQNN